MRRAEPLTARTCVIDQIHKIFRQLPTPIPGQIFTFFLAENTLSLISTSKNFSLNLV